MKKLKLRDEDRVSPEERAELLGDAIIEKASRDATRQGSIINLDGSLESASMKLRAFVERVERLKEEIKGLQGDVTEVLAEAKSEGFDVPTIKDLIKLRAMDEPIQKLCMLQLYCQRIGIDWPT